RNGLREPARQPLARQSEGESLARVGGESEGTHAAAAAGGNPHQRRRVLHHGLVFGVQAPRFRAATVEGILWRRCAVYSCGQTLGYYPRAIVSLRIARSYCGFGSLEGGTTPFIRM